MTPTRHASRPAAIAALLIAGLTLMPASPVAAAPADDELQQTIDPDQSQGTGQVIVDRGHVDFGPTLNTGEWIIQIHDDTGTPKYWRNPEDVVMKVNDAGKLTVPDSDAYAFLQQEPGTEVWVVPQTRNADVVWTGWNTQEPTVLQSLNLGTTLRVHGVEGPGDVSVYLQSGNFGDPQPLWSTFDAFPQETWIEVNTHTHANWVFSQPGIYLVDIEFEADLIDGRHVSAHDTLRFAVGDGTDPAPAFSAASSTAPPPGDIEQATDRESDAAAQNGDNLGPLTTVVLAAVAAALLAAIVIAVLATRRAKAKARAAATARAGSDAR